MRDLKFSDHLEEREEAENWKGSFVSLLIIYFFAGFLDTHYYWWWKLKDTEGAWEGKIYF